MKRALHRLFSIGMIMLFKNSKGNKMLSDSLLIPLYIIEPFIHTLVWIFINMALDHQLQQIHSFEQVFLLYLGISQWFCLRKIISGSAYDLHVYHALECMSFFTFKDLVLAKTLVYFSFYETYALVFCLIAVFVLKVNLSPMTLFILMASCVLWFIQLFLMKFIIMLIDNLIPFASNEIERGIDRFFYFGSSLFYSTNLLSDKAKIVMNYNPLYQFSTILKSMFAGDVLTMNELFFKQLWVCFATFLICLLFLATNRFALKKTRANQVFHLTTPY